MKEKLFVTLEWHSEHIIPHFIISQLFKKGSSTITSNVTRGTEARSFYGIGKDIKDTYTDHFRNFCTLIKT